LSLRGSFGRTGPLRVPPSTPWREGGTERCLPGSAATGQLNQERLLPYVTPCGPGASRCVRTQDLFGVVRHRSRLLRQWAGE
jgi:hypothetical protein